MFWKRNKTLCLSLQDMERSVFYTNLASRMEAQEIERLFTRVFSSEEGKKLLAYLQVTTFQRALGADSSDSQIRFAEGQRALVANISRLIERGRKQ
ncbi:MAG: hypothetical protein MRY79_09595 [Alphaproteobacteria bacterium]|nr:hypothetical protein [Alphaproteobacteria bacterium]